MYSQMWIKGLQPDVPNDFSEPVVVMEWLCMAWVFRHTNIFKNITRII